jgi:hypothetical protein
MQETELTFNGLHGVISQKIEHLVATAVRTLNHIIKINSSRIFQEYNFKFCHEKT